MAILVTGGAGYIGSHMVLALCDVGEEVVVLDDLSTGVRANVDPRAKFVTGDIADEALVKKLIVENGIRAVVHFAAKIVVPDSVADPLGYYYANTVKTRALLAAVTDTKVPHFVFSSTAAVYGNVSQEPVGEETPLAPASPYGSSKLISEWMLHDCAAAYGLKYVALRYFNVAGADPKGRTGQSTPRATHLIKVACEAATAKRNSMEVFGTDYPTKDGTCIRDYIHVSDLVQAHLDALNYLKSGGANAVLNCGYGTGYSVLEVVDTVKRISGVNFPVSIAPARAGDPAAIVARADKIKQTLGWQPKLDDLDTIVRHALAWEQKLRKKPAA
jgi:UDP-glucose 4-epimerase